MKLALLRHGRAADHTTWVGADADRPLTKAGILRCQSLFMHYRRLIDAEQIWTSPLLRARQTAEIAATEWRIPVREVNPLAAGAADSATCVERLRELGGRSALVVGHEPDLSELTAYLCGAKIDLRKAGLVMLEGDLQAGAMTLHGLFAPRHFIPSGNGPQPAI